MQKRFTFGNVAPAIWRWRWHWRWCCRPQQRSERGPGEARAQLCELHGRSRPPDCCPGSPWPTQIAQRSRCPSPQPKATSQGSTAQPGRAGPGAAWEEQGVVHGVYWIQFCIANANLHALRAGRKPPLFPCEERGARSGERGARREERGAGSGERGGPGRSGRCAGCVAGSNSHWQCRFRRPVTLPQAPALPMRRLRVHTLWSPRRLVCDQGPPRDPGRQTRARCACRAAP